MTTTTMLTTTATAETHAAEVLAHWLAINADRFGLRNAYGEATQDTRPSANRYGCADTATGRTVAALHRQTARAFLMLLRATEAHHAEVTADLSLALGGLTTAALVHLTDDLNDEEMDKLAVAVVADVPSILACMDLAPA